MDSIAVFIPVYNGGKYIRQTIESVLSQSYTNFKIYCVNDSSTDHSLSILEEMKSRDSRIEVFTKENGGGTAKSWNFILPLIHEDFIFYMSQDDLISADLFEKMIAKYRETGADCLMPQMILYYENGRNTDGIFGTEGEVISGQEALYRSLFWEVHGFALRKRELYQGEKFYEDAFDTDEYMTRKLFYKSRKVAFSGGYFYYRQDNPAAITKDFSLKNYYAMLTYQRVYRLLKKDNTIIKYRRLWFDFMIARYRDFANAYRTNRGISTEAEKKKVECLLRKSRMKLLYETIFVGRFWAKRIALKKILTINSK